MARKRRIDAFMPPGEAARAAALHHASDARPGIQRKRAGKGFSYRAADGTLVRDRRVLKRIRALAIPPAWIDVWISPDADGHIQATGRDARGRKQYRYHPRWREIRDATKYERLLQFGAALPRIRQAVAADLDRPGLPREKVLAVIVCLLDATAMRVGNEEYARANKSFGLTTLLNRHVDVAGSTMRFRFRGKSGKTHDIAVSDRRLARLVARCRELPGQELFQYLDDEGEPRPIDSADVNAYLQAISGEEFTAKEFRTWAGTVLAAGQLADSGAFDDDGAGKTAVTNAIAVVAKQLGNTPAICRKCYIHPLVLAAYENRELFDRWTAASAKAGVGAELEAEEAALVKFLENAPEA